MTDTDGFSWTEHDLSCASAVLGRPVDVESHYLLLTDEEVVAIDGLQHEQFVPLPWLSAVTDDPARYVEVALRGLLARGFLTADFSEPEIKLSALDDITGTMVLRRTPKSIIRVERSTAAATGWLYAYVHADRILIEDIDPNGMHSFTVADVEALLVRLNGIANPFGIAGSEATEPLVLSAEEFAGLTELPHPMAGAEAVTSLAIMSDAAGVGVNVVVYAGPQRLALLRPEPEGFFTISEVSATTVSGVIATSITHA